MNTILQAGLTAGVKDTRQGRLTVFFTPLDPFGAEAEEEYDDGLSKPRKVHYKNKWKVSQDAAYCFSVKKHKRKEYNSGRHDLMPLSFMIQCHLIASKKW